MVTSPKRFFIFNIFQFALMCRKIVLMTRTFTKWFQEGGTRTCWLRSVLPGRSLSVVCHATLRILGFLVETSLCRKKVIIKGLKAPQAENGPPRWMMDVGVKAEDEGRVEVKWSHVRSE